MPVPAAAPAAALFGRKPQEPKQQLASAPKKVDEELLGGDYEMVSQSSDTGETLGDAGQRQPAAPLPPVPTETRGLLTEETLKKQESAIYNVGRWAECQSCGGSSLSPALPQDGMFLPGGAPAHRKPKASRTVRLRDRPDPPSSGRPSTNSSEGFAHVPGENQTDKDVVGVGSRFDQPAAPHTLEGSLEVEELQAPAKRNPSLGSKTAKGRK